MGLKSDELKKSIIEFMSSQPYRPHNDECEIYLLDFYNWVEEQETDRKDKPSSHRNLRST